MKAYKRVRAKFREPAEDRYVAKVLSKIAAGIGHSTLGPLIRDEEYTRTKAETWAACMIAAGLRSDHLCVEYGCGSLWAAEPAIRFLDAGRYIGLDVTDKFYEFGRARIGNLLAEKQVRLGVISSAKLQEVAALRPDFIFSRKVLPHVPQVDLPRYIKRLCSLMSTNTVAMLDNTPMHDGEGGLTGRRHSVEAMRKLLPAGFEMQQGSDAAMLRRLR